MKRLIFLSGLILLSGFISAQNKVALVIGNSDYAEMPLQNPRNDAVDLAVLLRTFGFYVVEKTDLDRRGMEDAIREFKGVISPGDVALFYFSGHGTQVGGLNFLIPVGESVDDELDVKYNCVEAGFVLDHMEDARSGINIIILDACRNNPFKGNRSSNRGFAFMSAPTGSIIAYSTSPGNVAQDGDGRNSPFTKNLLEKMQIKDLKIEEVFKEVRKEVASETGRQQIPWESSSLMGDFYFCRSIFTAKVDDNVVEKKPEVYIPPPIVIKTDPKPVTKTDPKPVTKTEQNQASKSEPHEGFYGQSGSFTDTRDGKIYKWVRINDKIWMAENLNFGDMVSTDNNQSNDGINEKYCYDDDESNCTIYGGLYQWDEMMAYSIYVNNNGICPPGWVVPSSDDYLSMLKFAGESTAGISIKYLGHKYKKKKHNAQEKNTLGFTALLAGIRTYNSIFREFGTTGLFWTSTSEKMGKSKRRGNGAFRMKVHIQSPAASVSTTDKKFGLSVRCVRQ